MIKEVKNSGRKRLNKTLLASVLVMSLLNDVSACLAETVSIENVIEIGIKRRKKFEGLYQKGNFTQSEYG